MYVKSICLALVGFSLMTVPAFASDDTQSSRSIVRERIVALADPAPDAAIGGYKAPYGVSSLMCSPSGFGHVSTCMPKSYASRHPLIDVSAR